MMTFTYPDYPMPACNRILPLLFAGRVVSTLEPAEDHRYEIPSWRSSSAQISMATADPPPCLFASCDRRGMHF